MSEPEGDKELSIQNLLHHHVMNEQRSMSSSINID